jgi:hypothetical protein
VLGMLGAREEPRAGSPRIGDQNWQRSLPLHPAFLPHLPHTTYHTPPLFSTTFPLLAAKYLCFHRHSRFGVGCGKPTLCFHRHSRVVRRVLKNLFLSFPQRNRHIVQSKTGNFPSFCAARSTLEAGFGRRMSHYKKRAPLLLRVRAKSRFTILAYSLRHVKGHGVQSAARSLSL